MPTPTEKKALAFLAAVSVLGASVRLVQASTPHPLNATAESSAQLDRQLGAVDSARRAKRTAKGERKPRKSKPPKAAAGPPIGPNNRIDVDHADTTQLDRLPRIGPALARRIVANRDSFGAFGSLEKLHRVRGIGPAMLKALDSLVTFSGRP
ncbi:MAG: Helix-hairpin-helix DNA-binding class 1 [Gemmatimonadetes bacterium]|nr:Helix-hairpin-helix DNA-binding class 1 [Gemmatimonadota bacterium]